MPPTPLIQGTLDLLILRALLPGELHGLGIARRVEQITQNTFEVKAGSLFPALQRMADSGWLQGTWGTLDNGRRVRYYRLSASGRKQLRVEADQWHRVSAAMTAALEGI